jgi:hypothetical protein
LGNLLLTLLGQFPLQCQIIAEICLISDCVQLSITAEVCLISDRVQLSIAAEIYLISERVQLWTDKQLTALAVLHALVLLLTTPTHFNDAQQTAGPFIVVVLR